MTRTKVAATDQAVVDITYSHFLSLSGVKQTWAGAVRMSAFDPKRTYRHTDVS